MDKPLVTIITAAFNLIKNNRHKFFLEMVESVKNQTYSNIEHIIIDGASDDGSCELYKELGLKYVSEKDKGIYDAFNKGLNLANGKYINFMNSDDFFNNNKAVELSVNALEENNAVFSFASSTLINEDGSYNNTFKPKPHIALIRMPFCHQTMFVKTDILKAEGGFDMQYKSASDYDFIVKLFLKRYKYTVLKENIATFRMGGESTDNIYTSWSEQIKVHKNLYDKYDIRSEQEHFKFFANEFLPLSMLIKMPRFSFKTYFYMFKRGLKFRQRNIICFCASRFFKDTKSNNLPIWEAKSLEEYFGK